MMPERKWLEQVEGHRGHRKIRVGQFPDWCVYVHINEAS